MVAVDGAKLSVRWLILTQKTLFIPYWERTGLQSAQPESIISPLYIT